MRQRPWKPRRRLARVLRRSSLAWWSAALVLGFVTATTVRTSIATTNRATRDWGTLQRVWLVDEHVAAGVVIERGNVRLVERPTGVVPAAALRAGASPVGKAARTALVPGEILVTTRVAPYGATGVAALVAKGRRALAFKNDETMPVLRPGDRVDVLATFDVADDLDTGSANAAPSFPVALDAEVLTVSPRTIVVSVTTREAPRVAFALARAAVTLSLRGV